MIDEKTEGTVVLDGMLEGDLRLIAGGRARMEEWIADLKSHGLEFTLELDGDMFNLLATPQAVQADRLGGDVAHAFSQLLDGLMQSAPPAQRGRFFSTLRTTEYMPGRAEQTIYFVGPSGHVETRRRAMDAQTTAAQAPMSRRHRVKLVIAGVLAAGVAFAISTLFVDYGSLFSRAAQSVTSFDAADMKIDLGPFTRYFDVRQRERHGGVITLTLGRTAAFPKNAADLQAADDAADDLPARLAVEALARGHVRVDLFDREHKYIGVADVRIAELRVSETAKVNLPVTQDRPFFAVFGP